MKVIVIVRGGLVENIYANGDVDVEVVDLDVSDLPDASEQEAADAMEDKVNKTVEQEGWACVW